MPPIQGFLDILRSNGANIAARTNNLFLQRLVTGVQRVITLYDTNAAVSDKVHALDDVMIQAAFWLTSKKPRTVPKAGKAATTLPDFRSELNRSGNRTRLRKNSLEGQFGACH